MDLKLIEEDPVCFCVDKDFCKGSHSSIDEMVALIE
jgi:hypothetical protein